MPEGIDRQSIIDEEHLKLLSLGYMISAGIAAFFSVFGLFYILMGIVFGVAFSHLPAAAGKAGEQPPAFFGWFFAVIGFVIFLLAIGMALARFWTARCIKQRKSRTFCMVIAALGCLEFPYGTALSVFSFIVLGRESVAKRFTPQPGQ
jgi:fatty acid desaturase